MATGMIVAMASAASSTSSYGAMAGGRTDSGRRSGFGSTSHGHRTSL
jgi:hypothetical protein